MQIFFFVLVLIFSAILHEVMHGYVADWLGDPTARLAGRLTLNPISHLDPVGSVLVPIMDFLTGIPFPAWAKPVPYNPYNLPGRYDEALVAFAGPGSNILLAIIFAILLRFIEMGNVASGNAALIGAFGTIVFANIILALFNLLPIPPLDGSKVLAGILPGGIGRAYDTFRLGWERLGFFANITILYGFIYFFSGYFYAGLEGLFHILTGQYF